MLFYMDQLKFILLVFSISIVVKEAVFTIMVAFSTPFFNYFFLKFCYCWNKKQIHSMEVVFVGGGRLRIVEMKVLILSESSQIRWRKFLFCLPFFFWVNIVIIPSSSSFFLLECVIYSLLFAFVLLVISWNDN